MTTETFDLQDDAPPAVTGASREYNRYSGQAQALRSQPGKWLRLAAVDIQTPEYPEDADDAKRAELFMAAEKDARKRASNRVGMIRSGKGTWAGAEWACRVAQPGGPGTSFEIWVSYVKDKPMPVKPEIAPTEGTEAGTEVSAAASVAADAAVSETSDDPTPAPRRRR